MFIESIVISFQIWVSKPGVPYNTTVSLPTAEGCGFHQMEWILYLLWQHVQSLQLESVQAAIAFASPIWPALAPSCKIYWWSAFKKSQAPGMQGTLFNRADQRPISRSKYTCLWTDLHMGIKVQENPLCNAKTTISLFYHRMIVLRNTYTERCYSEGRKPLLPSLKLRKEKENVNETI